MTITAVGGGDNSPDRIRGTVTSARVREIMGSEIASIPLQVHLFEALLGSRIALIPISFCLFEALLSICKASVTFSFHRLMYFLAF